MSVPINIRIPFELNSFDAPSYASEYIPLAFSLLRMQKKLYLLHLFFQNFFLCTNMKNKKSAVNE